MRRFWGHLKTLYVKAYEDNLTGMSAMVAYNLLLSLLPLAFLALYIAGRLLESADLEQQTIDDLQQVFPTATKSTISTLLVRVRDQAATFGIVALVGSIWFGASFWGAMDTAFCRIYHLPCRSWVEQKRFALLMLVVVLLFMAATVAIPTAQSLATSGAGELPFGLAEVGAVYYAITIAGGLFVVFAILCLIYWTVPNRVRIPWRAIWPGALGATLAMGMVDYAFPAYLASVTTLARFGTTAVFVLILLIWFYALAIIILAGAEINATRLEAHETSNLETGRDGGTDVSADELETKTAAS